MSGFIGVDVCINCGEEHTSALGGATCDCGNPATVHKMKCSGCSAVMGQITDDDYCGPEKLYCPACITEALRLAGKP